MPYSDSEFDRVNSEFDDTETRIILDIIENSIEDEYYKSGIYKLLQKNDPELFIILVRQIIPKRKKQILYTYQLVKADVKAEALKEELKKLEEAIKEKSANLQPWDRETGWIVWNKVLEWALKAGLTVVPILSLFSMIGLTRLDDLRSNWGIAASFSVIASVLLVWATSATIYNWVISEDEKAPLDEKLITLVKIPYPVDFMNGKWSSTPWQVNKFRLLIFIVWLAEALLGFATIPSLIETSRVGTSSPGLSMLEKLEILVGTSIFAYINIWFSVARGRVYRVNTPKRIELSKEAGKKLGVQGRLNQCQTRIKDLEAKIRDLDLEIMNPVNGSTDFSGKFTDLSDILTRGRNYIRDEALINELDQNQQNEGIEE